jgi:hypothetical protein
MTLSAPSSPSALPARFVAGAGSVTGRDHRRAHRDGQDGFALVATPDVTAAIVTDGCSSGRTSEVGARLGAAWLAELVATSFSGNRDPERCAEEVTVALIERIATTARSLSGRGAIESGVVADMLLFGFLAAVTAGPTAIVFGVGDGVVWIDGTATAIDPGPDNAPPYAAYALFGATITPRVLHVGRADALEIVAVATDGAAELLSEADQPSELDAIVRDARVVGNPSLLRKRLIVLSDRGRFWDDVTIAVVRRRA